MPERVSLILQGIKCLILNLSPVRPPLTKSLKLFLPIEISVTQLFLNVILPALSIILN